MKKGKVEKILSLSMEINKMSTETFKHLCRQLSDQRKDEMEYQCFMNHAFKKLHHEIKENKISISEIEDTVDKIIAISHEIGNEDDILYRITEYTSNIKNKTEEIGGIKR